MTSAVRNIRQPRRLTFRWMAGLLLIVGLLVTALIVALVLNESSSPAQNSHVQAPVSTTPTPEAPEQALLADENESSESTGTETPESTPTSTSNPTAPDVEPTPETGSVNPTESPDGTGTPGATGVPETESSSDFVGNSAGSNENNPSSTAGQGTSDPAPTAPTQGTGSTRQSTMTIQIPAIGVNAPVEVKSIDANGVMQNPSSAHAVAWYDFTSRPEDRGNAVFAGHLDYAGVGPAVFWKLGSLLPGDEVNVTLGNGSVVKYRITGVRSVHMDADASDIVASGNVAKITIITCGGSFDPTNQEYDQRIVVTGERVG